MAGVDDLLGGRQILVDHVLSQVLRVLEGRPATWASNAAAGSRGFRVLDVGQVVQINVPGIALVAVNPDVPAGWAAQEHQVFVPTTLEVSVLDVLVVEQKRIIRLDVWHGEGSGGRCEVGLAECNRPKDATAASPWKSSPAAIRQAQ